MPFTTHLNLAESATVAMNSLAAEKKAKGERIYNLSAGEPMLPPHAAMCVAAEQAIQAGKTLYPPVAGVPELRAAVASWMNTTYHTNFSSQETLVTCGGKFGIYALLQSAISQGDEVIIISPYWVSYPALITLFGGKSIIVETKIENNWQLPIAEIKQKITARTKMIIINNCNNPTGVVYKPEVLHDLVTLVREKNILLLSDEVYSGLTYQDEFVSVASFPEVQTSKENIVVIQSCSKHFAMTGWRVGFVFADTAVIKVLTKIQSQSTTGTSSISQYAALGALNQANTIMLDVKTTMQKRRDVFVSEFNKLFGCNIPAPASGLYCFFPLKIIGVMNILSAEFCQRALSEAGVALTPGSAFGKEGYVRASFGAEEAELIDSLQVLNKWIVKKMSI
ncbi:MAG: aminotransferase class I/II-fold pyridoxal phosphate-dependent enzyme [Patescibacteria group bacterium]